MTLMAVFTVFVYTDGINSSRIFYHRQPITRETNEDYSLNCCHRSLSLHPNFSSMNFYETQSESQFSRKFFLYISPIFFILACPNKLLSSSEAAIMLYSFLSFLCYLEYTCSRNCNRVLIILLKIHCVSYVACFASVTWKEHTRGGRPWLKAPVFFTGWADRLKLQTSLNLTILT